MRESQFSKKVRAKLDALIKQGLPIYYFVKEAGSIRGIPDVIISCNGVFCAWELKCSSSEAGKTSGRIALQRYTLQRIRISQGHGWIVHPDNVEEVLQEMLWKCNLKPVGDTSAPPSEPTA